MTATPSLAANSFLPPLAAADFIRAKGFPTTKRTLAKLRCVGGGPAFRRFGRRIVYEREELINWIERRLSPKCLSTSDTNAVLRSPKFSQGLHHVSDMRGAL